MIGNAEIGIIIAILLILLFGIALMMSLYFFYKYKMANPTEYSFKSKKVKNTWFRIAIVVLGIAIGIIIGEVLNSIGVIESNALYFSIILICLGVSMLIANNKDKKDSIEE